ncbi:ABC transporter permease [Hyphomicrobium sp. 99]|uniref:ABC transporter permease n=1 Tax=Hyphomicrobium sp. 99 TaxID=1163419 RepID=UPI0009E6395E|nr:ABC transporter permease [Hyphomicrobium sp. 99]
MSDAVSKLTLSHTDPSREGVKPSRSNLVKARPFLGVIGLAILIGAWWASIHFLAEPDGLAERFSPSATFASLVALLTNSDLLIHIEVSLKRISVGLGLALLIGVPVGLIVGISRTAESATSISFQFLRMISPLSWMPIAVMALGVGDYPIYFLLTFAAVWPILLNTSAGVRSLDPAWLQLSKSLAATPTETLLHVILPGVLGHVLTGIRLAIGILWIVLVPCEMLGVSAGLGYFILDTRDRLAYSELTAVVLVIGFLGFLLDWAARSLHRVWSPG